MQRPMVVPPNLLRSVMEDPKAAFRRQCRGARRAFVEMLSMAVRERLENDLAAIVAPLLGGHRIIASYAAVDPEIDPRSVEAIARSISSSHEVLAEAGVVIAFPRVNGRTMAFHTATRPDLVPRTLGIPEPDAGAPQVIPSLLLVPLLAVTTAGVRLGQGGGYYDRTLRSLRATGAITAIGLAWDVQVTDALPRDPWDEVLDWVATPTRLVDCRKAR